MVKNKISLILLIILLLVLIDSVIYLTGNVGIINNTYRAIAGAPALKINGDRMSYNGKVRLQSNQLEEYRLSDSNMKLFKANDTPEIPPWIYLKEEGEVYFRYKFPKVPWKL
ncbi:hypothetical protein BK133_11765 [Paenibacillus sp. FSL H8-0548]|uniref:hypothetical protein n=1 Tax=Paenibacillus sp. FSL H8-0548 TaxID=1920422 RepID=UPI00096D97D1|nr:hypothetical protein [Paenibacillus sp. FSL H8-0548]OMF34681.1 hypothetical protein BK133_11765 [Paenibacillus sp. FSL H8-0548]